VMVGVVFGMAAGFLGVRRRVRIEHVAWVFRHVWIAEAWRMKLLGVGGGLLVLRR